jgi:hypothetical protein
MSTRRKELGCLLVAKSTLFTIAMDPSTQHTLYVYNIGSDGSSQINLNNLNVDGN